MVTSKEPCHTERAQRVEVPQSVQVMRLNWQSHSISAPSFSPLERGAGVCFFDLKI
jgi:hypothetical protein